MLKKKIGNNSLGTAKWYFPFKHWESSVDVCECSGCPTTGAQTKRWRKFIQSTTKTDEVPLW
jgi:hypothetical protein